MSKAAEKWLKRAQKNAHSLNRTIDCVTMPLTTFYQLMSDKGKVYTYEKDKEKKIRINGRSANVKIGSSLNVIHSDII